MVTIFQAKHGTVAYSSAAVTWDTAARLSAETFTGNVSEMKDATITLPEMAVEQVMLMGNSQQTIGINTINSGSSTGITPGYWQNSMLDYKPASNWKFAGTVVFTGDEQFFHVLGLGQSTTIVGAATATRYAVGDLNSSGNIFKTLVGCLRLTLNNGSEEAVVGMTNVVITKIGDLKVTGADGHWECSVEAECLPKDGALEFLD